MQRDGRAWGTRASCVPPDFTLQWIRPSSSCSRWEGQGRFVCLALSTPTIPRHQPWGPAQAVLPSRAPVGRAAQASKTARALPPRRLSKGAARDAHQISMQSRAHARTAPPTRLLSQAPLVWPIACVCLVSSCQTGRAARRAPKAFTLHTRPTPLAWRAPRAVPRLGQGPPS